jgi:hypothetical protein
MKKKQRSPLRMWAVCYRDIGRFPGWTPYSGELYYYREDAEEKANGTTNGVMAVLVTPTGYVRGPDNGPAEHS